MAPFAPFLSDRLYLNLTEGSGGRESVHLCSYPVSNSALIDEDLERRMEDVRRIVRLGRAARNRASVKTRQPLNRVRIVPPGGRRLEDLKEVVLEELNVKDAEICEPGKALSELHVKARFDVLGPRFGKEMKSVGAAIAALTTPAIEQLERSGAIRIEVGGRALEIRKEEVITSHVDPPGWAMEREGGWSVAIDLTIDEELREEGFARELVNKIQFMRKNAGFEITDRIESAVETTDSLWRAIERHHDFICRETLTDRLVRESIPGEAREEWNINGEPAVLSLRRVTSGVR
jgi:isoleucyl-tRNA synthetase